jgi:nitroimidazol reductase NimA-like FMN-containing flavoprotein (pyridoxamine 5'-phosphate oxidase superfamily)
MRRQDRKISDEAALDIVDKCVYAVLSTVSEDGTPYGVPVSIVREGNNIYFHGALEGHKADNIARSPEVSLCCVGEVSEPADDFTVLYESAIIFGRASLIPEKQDKIHALRLLCERHTPAHMAVFDEYVEKLIHRTAVWKISIEGVSGKRH